MDAYVRDYSRLLAAKYVEKLEANLQEESTAEIDAARAALIELQDAVHRPYSKGEYLERIEDARVALDAAIAEYNAVVASNAAEIDRVARANVAAVAAKAETLEVLLEAVRKRRSELLAATDFRMVSDFPWKHDMKNAWTDYRQALRDITNNLKTVADVEALVMPLPPQ